MLIVGPTCPSISCLSFIRHFSGSAWLKYDLVFRKDAAVSGLSDWSIQLSLKVSSHGFTPATSVVFFHGISDTSLVPPFCHSWNDVQCSWPFGRCKYRHHCSNCGGDHTRINCPFPNSSGTVLNGRLCPVRLVYIVQIVLLRRQASRVICFPRSSRLVLL